ncbi:DUF3048 domain-containing protein [Streptomyces roseirectus]|uniref:DUF3048 domain-containing protein n=1 Tax=Streptomyces roseirectus TaxID=2768066 RepID=A0A7H0IS51_9ACTN|nr:DUF3048 domain-containing protein [Streptomyces roseirectus]
MTRSNPKRTSPATGTPPTRTRTAAALLATALTAALVAGCATTPRAGGDDSVNGSLKPRARTGPVLAVKIDNARAARPHTGLGAADVVYVEPVEGGMSRLMAVYATKLPPAVGPVRSARQSDLELLRQFDRPVLAFSGAQRKLHPLIDRAPLRAVEPGEVSGAYYRGRSKRAPHNLYLRPRRLVRAAPGAGALEATGFRFGPAPSGGRATVSRTVRYPAARFTFTWSAARGRWLVAMDGRAARTVAPATVVVQYVKVRKSRFRDVLGNHTPYPQTVGSGRASVLRGGRAYDVVWERARAADGTRFRTRDGRRVDFAPGQVWVVLARAS